MSGWKLLAGKADGSSLEGGIPGNHFRERIWLSRLVRSWKEFVGMQVEKSVVIDPFPPALGHWCRGCVCLLDLSCGLEFSCPTRFGQGLFVYSVSYFVLKNKSSQV